MRLMMRSNVSLSGLLVSSTAANALGTLAAARNSCSILRATDRVRLLAYLFGVVNDDLTGIRVAVSKGQCKNQGGAAQHQHGYFETDATVRLDHYCGPR